LTQIKKYINNNLFRFNDSNLSTWDSSFSKSMDTTDGISSFYTSLNDHRAAILEEKQEDFIPYTPLDKGIFDGLIYYLLFINL